MKSFRILTLSIVSFLLSCGSIILLVLTASSEVVAQRQTSDRIGLGVSYAALDAPDNLVFLPKLSYQHQFQKRLFVSADMGYLSYKGWDNSFQQVPESRKRFTLDLAAKFSVLTFGESHLRIGAGPSLWRIDDEVMKELFYENGQVTSYKLLERHYWDVGANMGLELDIHLSKRLSMMGNFQLVKLSKWDLSPQLGVNTFYRIR